MERKKKLNNRPTTLVITDRKFGFFTWLEKFVRINILENFGTTKCTTTHYYYYYY
jgi:hypothetical protein